MFFKRKRSANAAAQQRVFCLRESEAAATTTPMLVTQSLPQDVALLD